MTNALDPTDDLTFRRVLGHFATGLAVVTGDHDGTRAGFTCQSFTSVSLRPPLVGFFARKESQSWAMIRASGRFCVNVLARDQEMVARTFATPGIDKFHDLPTVGAPSGSPILPGVIAWIDCSIEIVADAGDHDSVLGSVTSLAHVADSMPLLYFRGGYGTFAP